MYTGKGGIEMSKPTSADTVKADAARLRRGRSG